MKPFREVTVGESAELLPFLLTNWSGVKRKTVQGWLKFRQVTVNGDAVTRFNHRLVPGDIVGVAREPVARKGGRLGTGLRIRYEDEHVIVIEKPSGLLSMASERERDRTAFAQLMRHVRQGDPRSRERVFIVHRLDKETSGLMIFARSETAKRRLQDNWDATTKRYLALVEGRLAHREGCFESHLDESDPLRVKSFPNARPRTRPARTEYRVLRETTRCSLVELTLVTGRRHQIRVHVAGAGCPIVGDVRYGARGNPAGRLGLHAAFLELKHPLNDTPLSFESPLPRELAIFDRW